MIFPTVTPTLRNTLFTAIPSGGLSGLLDQYGGAAAAYSLRALSSGWLAGDVVEVRRSLDGALRSFTAAEVANSTLLNWVAPRLDLQPETGALVGNVTNETATGFDFSVNNEGSLGFKQLLPLANVTTGTYTATFDVVLNSGSFSEVIIRSGNPQEEAVLVAGANSFTCTPSGIAGIYFRTANTAVADVSITNLTLTKTSADGFVSKWYDQSGNDNHATQATTTAQPKIVSAGALITGGLDFDGTDDSLEANAVAASFTGTDQPLSAFAVGTVDVSKAHYIWTLGNSASDTSFMGAGGNSGPYRAIERDSTATLANISGGTFSSESLVTYITTGNQRELFADGVSQASDSTNLAAKPFDQFQVGRLLRTTAIAYWNGKISTVVLYDSDQTANRVGIEAIINAL